MQVTEDQRLLREKVQHLSGDAGIERMECALSETRSRYFRVNENGSPMGSPLTQSLAPITANFTSVPSVGSSSSERNAPINSNQSTSHVARSLFKDASIYPPEGSKISALGTTSDGQWGSSIGKLVTENEVLVNEFLHEHHHSFSDVFGNADQNQNSIEVSV